MVALKTQFEHALQVNVPESTLVLVGTALDGPSGIPFRINQTLETNTILGNSPLARAFDVVKESMPTDVILYRLNGHHAFCDVPYRKLNTNTGQEEEHLGLRFKSVSANDTVNNIFIHLVEHYLIVTTTTGVQRTYNLEHYQTMANFVHALNTDADYGLLEFEVIEYDESAHPLLFRDMNYSAFFTGGSSGSDLIPNRANDEDISATLAALKTQLNRSLFGEDEDEQASYEINTELGLLDYGLICLVDMFHDDEMGFTKILGNFCLSKSTRLNQGCLGMVGTKPVVERTNEAVATKLQNLFNLSMEDRRSNLGYKLDMGEDTTVDYFSHVQVVVGDLLVSDILGYYIQPAVYSYAGLQSSTAIHTSLSNKKLYGFDRLSYEFNKEDVDSLLANGYISIVSSIRKRFVPYQSITYFSKKDSFYNRPHALRITHYVSRYLVNSLSSVIGQTIYPLTKKEVEALAQRTVEQLMTADMVKSHELQVRFVSKTEIEVRLNILPYSEVTAIPSIIRLPFSSEVIQ